jgi:hypothetical protein
MAYKVFHRTWWRREGGRLVPHAGRKTIIQAHVETEEEARAICRQWNAAHDPGPLSRKAEYDSR